MDANLERCRGLFSDLLRDAYANNTTQDQCIGAAEAGAYLLAEIERLTRDHVGAHRVSILTIRHLEAEIERLRAALQLFVGCAYPVATEINPRGHAWRPEESLDYALGEARKVLAHEQSPRPTEE